MVLSAPYFWGSRMPNILLPILLTLLLGFAGWTLWGDAKSAEARAVAAEAKVVDLTASNEAMEKAISEQNTQILAMREDLVEAEARAEDVLKPLPELIKKDRAVGTQPQEMNQWVDGLFSQP